MDKGAIDAMLDNMKEPMRLGELDYCPNDWKVFDPVTLIKPGPSAVPLPVGTLGAVALYLEANRDNLDLARLVVHVVDPQRVQVLGPLSARSRSREMFVAATIEDLLDAFLDRFMPLEEFIIGLQWRVVAREDCMKLISLLSNVKSDKVQTALDDGVSQTVTAKTGIALVTEVKVPNPVTLCGFRTFREISQPATEYVLRLQQGRSGVEAMLCEADGGAWQLDAVARVRQWLVEALPPAVTVLA